MLSVLACGICGSDLHARHHADAVADAAAAAGYLDLMRPADAVVLGHEFCGEVAELGPGVSKWRIGTPVVAMPMVRADGAVHLTGLTPKAPGGYAEQVLVQDAAHLRGAQRPRARPPPRSPSRWRSRCTPYAADGVGKGQAAIVVGCGPIGLGVIAMLKAAGVRRVVASDFSPGRRALAEAMGADVVVDPRVDSPYEVRHQRLHRRARAARARRRHDGEAARGAVPAVAPRVRGRREAGRRRRAVRWSSSASACPASSTR